MKSRSNKVLSGLPFVSAQLAGRILAGGMLASGMLAGGMLASAILVTQPVHAQSLLRGATDEDPIQRVGRTASEQSRNAITPTGTRVTGQPSLQQARQRRSVSTSTRQSTANDQPAGSQATAERPTRPPQQNFRSLEKPLNTAVPSPTGGQLVYQGLPAQVTPQRRSNVQANPYDPIGLRLGAFQVFPTADVLLGYDSNPLSATSGRTKKSAAYTRTELGFTARSDLATHEVSADFRGGYSKFFGIVGADRPDGQGRIGLRLDASRDTAFDFELRGRIDTETPGTANLVGGTSERPLTFQSGASAGITHRMNRLAVSARATADRFTFSDTTLSGGGALNQQDRNFNQYGLRLRTGYEITPGFVPFTEVLIDQRQRDQAVDSSGFRRDSNGVQVRAGTSLEFTRTVTGEVLAGYGTRKFADSRLRELRGPIVEGALAWSVSPLTTMRLRAATEFGETTQVNSSGSITKRLTAEVSHAFLRNLVMTGAVNFSRADFKGISLQEDSIRTSLGLDYSLSPNLVLRGSVANQRTISSTAGSGITANTYLFGARLQF